MTSDGEHQKNVLSNFSFMRPDFLYKHVPRLKFWSHFQKQLSARKIPIKMVLLLKNCLKNSLAGETLQKKNSHGDFPEKLPPKCSIERFFQEFSPMFTSNRFKMISICLSHMFCILKSISAFRAFRKTNF